MICHESFVFLFVYFFFLFFAFFARLLVYAIIFFTSSVSAFVPFSTRFFCFSDMKCDFLLLCLLLFSCRRSRLILTFISWTGTSYYLCFLLVSLKRVGEKYRWYGISTVYHCTVQCSAVQ